MRLRRFISALMFLGLSACSTEKADTPGLQGFERPPEGEIGAQVVSYDVVAGRPTRIALGIVEGSDRLIGYGSVTMEFAHVGDGTEEISDAKVELTATAGYVLVAGQVASSNTSGPRRIQASDGLGVYRAELTLPRSGVWLVEVALPDGRRAQATVEANDEPRLPYPGDRAPLTRNRLANDTTVSPSAIDSRADESRPIPDPELHDGTVADAIAAKKPVLVVVSTPTFCQSQFCGPITDRIHELATRVGDRMEFVHLEVWNDFEAGVVNRDAAEWIVRPGVETQEPWVFVVGADGLIAKRFDNVVTDADLELAIATESKEQTS